jgi:hypothetical protein
MIEWVFANKEWFLSGLGITILGSVGKIVQAINQTRQNNNIFVKGLSGNYMTYFPRPHNTNDFIKCPLKIYTSLTGKLKAELKIREFTYKGMLEVHDGTIFIDLTSSGSKTHFIAYLQRSIGIHSNLEGVHISCSRLRIPIASKILAEKTVFDFDHSNCEFICKSNLREDIEAFFISKTAILYPSNKDFIPSEQRRNGGMVNIASAALKAFQKHD